MSEHFTHGGALGAAIRRFGGAPGDWLDLSTGINPAPPPLPPLAADLWTRLPDAALEAAALDAARRFTGAPVDAGLVAAPGSQALISLLPHLLPPGPAAILDPSYGEHARAFRAAGHAVRPLPDPIAPLGDARSLVLVNPNNPDGRRFERVRLLELAGQLAERGGHLIVDEAFMDADPRESLALDAGRPGLVVLRSFGKFFGLAGLRLGFALAPAALAGRMAERLGPWAVSGPALAVARAFLGDAALVGRVRAEIATQAMRTRAAIRAAGLEPTGDAALFALVDVPDAHALFEALARRRILTRPFAPMPRALRLGTVRDEHQADRLTAALREALAETGQDGAGRSGD